MTRSTIRPTADRSVTQGQQAERSMQQLQQQIQSYVQQHNLQMQVQTRIERTGRELVITLFTDSALRQRQRRIAPRDGGDTRSGRRLVEESQRTTSGSREHRQRADLTPRSTPATGSFRRPAPSASHVSWSSTYGLAPGPHLGVQATASIARSYPNDTPAAHVSEPARRPGDPPSAAQAASEEQRPARQPAPALRAEKKP